MPNKKLNTSRLWKQFTDVVVPSLRFSLTDRAVYLHLLRHSHLEQRTRLRFSILWLARGAGLSTQPTRRAVRRLVAQGALRLIQRTKAGHIVEVRLPSEIPTLSSRLARNAAARSSRTLNLEALDFSQDQRLREAIHARERGLCFYCLSRVTRAVRCLDHVLPQAHAVRNSYRNLVSCCLGCNSEKQEQPAPDFLRSLYRQRRLNATELAARLRALDDLAAGKLRPTLPLNTVSLNTAPRRRVPPACPPVGASLPWPEPRRQRVPSSPAATTLARTRRASPGRSSAKATNR